MTKEFARSVSRATARKFGIILETRFSGGWYEIIATAPQGYVFKNLDLHEIVIANAGPQVDGLWERLYPELQNGVEPCNDPDCEWCNNV